MSSKFTESEKAQAIETLIKAMNIIESLPTAKGCYACLNFHEDNNCAHFNQVVPSEHRATGCNNFLSDIPF